MIVGVCECKFRGLLADSRCSVRSRELPGLMKHDEAESAHNHETERTENRARDLSPVLLRLAEGTPQAEHEQSEAGAEKKEVNPGHITRDWKPGK